MIYVGFLDRQGGMLVATMAEAWSAITQRFPDAFTERPWLSLDANRSWYYASKVAYLRVGPDRQEEHVRRPVATLVNVGNDPPEPGAIVAWKRPQPGH